MRDLFDHNAGPRAEVEWRELLTALVSSLSRYCGVAFVPTSWYTGDDKPGDAAASNCVNVRGVVNAALRLEACGVVCISVTFGKAARASANMLLYSGGRRVFGPNGKEIVSLLYCPEGWVSQRWTNGECGEWEGYPTDARWQ